MLNMASSSCFSSDLPRGARGSGGGGCGRSPGLECCDESSGDDGWLSALDAPGCERADRVGDEAAAAMRDGLNPGGGATLARLSCCS